jgi:lysophospholipase L1-like esterase
VACSGAVVHDAYATNHSSPAELPQLSALSPSDRLVTLSFGGNDLDFAGVVAGCVTPGKTAVDCIGVDQTKLKKLGYQTKSGDANDGRLVSILDSGSHHAMTHRLVSEFGQAVGGALPANLLQQAGSYSDSLSVHDRLVFLLRVIHELAPDARILVLGYPRWFDPGGSSHDVEHYKPLEQTWLNDRIGLADEVIRDAVGQSGVGRYVNVYRAFTGHEESGTTTIWPVDGNGNATCQGPGTYINGVDFLAHQFSNSPELMHPNPCGHQALARAVERTYAKRGSRSVAPLLPPAAQITVKDHHAQGPFGVFGCQETFEAHVHKTALARVRTFRWFNDGGDAQTHNVAGPRNDTMTMTAHSAFHFLLLVHGTNGQNRYIAYNEHVKC